MDSNRKDYILVKITVKIYIESRNIITLRLGYDSVSKELVLRTWKQEDGKFILSYIVCSRIA